MGYQAACPESAVGATTGKAYYAAYRIGKGRGGVPKQVKIADVSSMSLDDVRYRVGQIVTEARHNIDLLEQEKADEKQREIERVNKALRPFNAANPDDATFLKSAWMAYAALKKSTQSKKTHANLVARFRHFETLFKQDVKTADIKPADLEKLREHLAGKQVAFSATIAALSSVLNNESTKEESKEIFARE